MSSTYFFWQRFKILLHQLLLSIICKNIIFYSIVYNESYGIFPLIVWYKKQRFPFYFNSTIQYRYTYKKRQNGLNLYELHMSVTWFESEEIHGQLSYHLSNTELNEMSNWNHKMMTNISQSFKFYINIKIYIICKSHKLIYLIFILNNYYTVRMTFGINIMMNGVHNSVYIFHKYIVGQCVDMYYLQF